MQKSVLVLGGGRVGRAIAFDLSSRYDITVADRDEQRLHELGSELKIATEQADLMDKKTISHLVKSYDLIIGAVPGFMGFETAKTVIESGKNLVDISFFPEDPFLLDELAKIYGSTVIMDCGVAPGLDNILLGYHDKRMQVEEFICYVGGLPKYPEAPYFYKAPFSPIDVLEEYIRPARIVENSKEVVREALSEIELLEFPRAGRLEAFNTDGLRSLIKTMPHIPWMKEKTLRYPKHVEYIEVLKKTGLLSSEERSVDGKMIRPIDLTARLLFPMWQLKPGEVEFTVMRVIIRGIEAEQKVEYIYDLYDEYDPTTDISSMARTTGYTCTAAANLVLQQKYISPGIHPPEFLGKDEANFNFLLDHLKERNIELLAQKREIV